MATMQPTPILGWIRCSPTPPFPAYISGHSTFSAAAATVLAGFYGTDQVAFTTGSDFLPECSGDSAASRLRPTKRRSAGCMGGIHYPVCQPDGLASGMAVGIWTVSKYLQPTNHRLRR